MLGTQQRCYHQPDETQVSHRHFFVNKWSERSFSRKGGLCISYRNCTERDILGLSVSQDAVDVDRRRVQSKRPQHTGQTYPMSSN